MITSPIISFGSNALAIKQDATFSLTAGILQSFSNLDDLKTGAQTLKPYATFEPDFWLLDGNYKLKPSTAVHVGLMTTDISGSGLGTFATRPELTITFTTVHSTNNLTLHFSEYTNDYCDDLNIKYYDAADLLIDNNSYEPSSYDFSTSHAVSNFKKIVIEFASSNKPYRYLRLTAIDFDTLTTFDSSDIKSARLVEEINPLSVELPYNTLDFSLFSADGDFSIVNPMGVYANLQYKEPVEVFEQIGNEIIYMGRFYLDDWKSRSENIADFKASDAVGLLDRPTYLGGWWGAPFSTPNDLILSEDLILAIMTAAGVDYELDASLEGIELTGHVPILSCREALKLACFAIGAYATCARSNILQIKPFELASDLISYDYTITTTQKGQNSPVGLRPLVTGVTVQENNYAVFDLGLGAGLGKTIYDGTLAAGTHTIIFDNPPIPEFDSTGTATVSDQDGYFNYAIVVITSPGTYLMHLVREITRTKKPYEINNGTLPAGTPINIIYIEDATLVNSGNSSVVTQRVYDYYLQRYLQKTKLFTHQLAVGDSVLIDTQSSRQIKGIAEKISIDLANGFVSEAEIVGVVVAV